MLRLLCLSRVTMEMIKIEASLDCPYNNLGERWLKTGKRILKNIFLYSTFYCTYPYVVTTYVLVTVGKGLVLTLLANLRDWFRQTICFIIKYVLEIFLIKSSLTMYIVHCTMYKHILYYDNSESAQSHIMRFIFVW